MINKKDKNKKKKDINKKIKKETTIKNTKKVKLNGIIISDKMQETVVVAIDRFIVNSKYKKRLHLTKKVKAHNKDNKYKVGDMVVIEECRPISKEKKWIII